MVKVDWLQAGYLGVSGVFLYCAWLNWRAYKKWQRAGEQYMRALSLLAQREEWSREEVERVKREGEREGE